MAALEPVADRRGRLGAVAIRCRRSGLRRRAKRKCRKQQPEHNATVCNLEASHGLVLLGLLGPWCRTAFDLTFGVVSQLARRHRHLPCCHPEWVLPRVTNAARVRMSMSYSKVLLPLLRRSLMTIS